ESFIFLQSVVAVFILTKILRRKRHTAKQESRRRGFGIKESFIFLQSVVAVFILTKIPSLT
ncbi:MAG: hypothetical protein Q4D67_02345, partial [Streptococcus minor]|nr:hypothetical protein [Streptococcus minor]